MAKKLFTPTAPIKKGALVTSMPDLTKATPMQPPSIGGDVVGGYPLNIRGGNSGATKSVKKGAKPKRKLMY